MGSQRTITIKGDGVRKEGLANGAITPGHLLQREATGTDVAVHGTAGGFAAPAFAVEDDLQGQEIGDDYADNEQCLYCVFRHGDEVHALIADGEDIDRGDYLESAGDGTLREVITGEIVAMALEACDMTGSAGADNPRCIVEVV